jgi:hypothetical protein
MADADPAPARESPSAAQLRVLMEHLNKFNPAFTEVSQGVADRRAGDRKSRVNAAVAELTPLLPLADTPYVAGYHTPQARIHTMAVAINNRNIDHTQFMPIRRLVNTDDAQNILPYVIYRLNDAGVNRAAEKVAALYVASRLPTIEVPPTMHQLSQRSRDIQRLLREYMRRFHGALDTTEQEQRLLTSVRDGRR